MKFHIVKKWYWYELSTLLLASLVIEPEEDLISNVTKITYEFSVTTLLLPIIKLICLKGELTSLESRCPIYRCWVDFSSSKSS